MNSEATVIEIELTAEQQELLYDTSAILISHLRFSRVQLCAAILAANALERGIPLATVRLPVTLPLTLPQQEDLHQRTGLRGTALTLDPDGLTARYLEEWKESTAPQRLGRSLWLHSGDAGMRRAPDERVVLLPESGAEGGSSEGVFGSGRHTTTQLAAYLLEEAIRPGDRVLDLGTGSGVLAIAAARLGAGEVVALDVDPRAAATARRNAAANGLEDRIRALHGGLEAAPGSPYDLVVVNIVPGELLRVVPMLKTVVRAGGTLIVSGVPASRFENIMETIQSTGFTRTAHRSEAGWNAVVLRRAAEGSPS